MNEKKEQTINIDEKNDLEDKKSSVESNDQEDPIDNNDSSLQEEVDQLKDRLIRLQADYENYRRRTEKEKQNSVNLGIQTLAVDILPVLDNIERAIESFKEEGLGESQIEGITMIEQGLIEALSKYGIEQIEALGEPFDPTLHNAIQVIETEDHKPDTVMIEVNKGYTSEEKVIRPSTVIVSQ